MKLAVKGKQNPWKTVKNQVHQLVLQPNMYNDENHFPSLLDWLFVWQLCGCLENWWLWRMIGYESANFFCFTLHAIQAAKVNLQLENQIEICSEVE